MGRAAALVPGLAVAALLLAVAALLLGAAPAGAQQLTPFQGRNV